jgi:IS30 family transposase
MKHAPRRQWTETEVRRLKTLVTQKVSAEGIATALGRHEEKRES